MEEMIGLAGLAIQGAGFAFLIGRHSQRITTNEADVADLKRKADAHAATLAEVGGMKALLEEVRHDVKNLLTGRVRPASRSSDRAD